MNFRSSLRDFAKGGLSPVRFPEKTAIERAKRELEYTLGSTAGTLKPPEDLDAVAARIADRLEKGQELELRDLHRAPWCIWHAVMRERVKLVKALLDQIEERSQRRSYRALGAAWLYHFKPAAFAIFLVGDFLARNVERLGYPYTEAQASYYLFDARGGPSRIADIAIRTGQTPDAILSSGNIRGNAVGYREQVYRNGFLKLHGEADPATRLETIERWFWEGTKKVRFDTLRAEAVSAALEPFGDVMPVKDIRDSFLAFALDVVGDPRVHTTNWRDCENAREIACRWLTEQSLRQFFEVVDRVAKPEQWDYRHAFWNAIYRKGHITDAWVVFDVHGEREAKRLFRQSINFARFDNPVQRGSAVLLLRIGSLVVAEWSQNGKCRIWDRSKGELGPKLYKQSYNVSEVRPDRNPEGTFTHFHSDSYRWQGEIADYLRRHCNIRLSIDDYRVH